MDLHSTLAMFHCVTLEEAVARARAHQIYHDRRAEEQSTQRARGLMMRINRIRLRGRGPEALLKEAPRPVQEDDRGLLCMQRIGTLCCCMSTSNTVVATSTIVSAHALVASTSARSTTYLVAPIADSPILP